MAAKTAKATTTIMTTTTITDGIAPRNVWLSQAYRVVDAHYPNIDWSTETEETIAAEAHLDFVLGAYFQHEGGIGNIKLQDVTEAWRRYYRAHLPVSPMGEKNG